MNHATWKTRERRKRDIRAVKWYLSVSALVEFEKEPTGSDPLSSPSSATEGWGSLM